MRLAPRPRVLSGGRVVATWPAATTVDTGRTVAALAGSATSVAAVVETCTTDADGDTVFFGGAGAFVPFGRAVRYDLVTNGKRRLGRAEAVDVQADGRVAIVRGGCVWLGRRRLDCGVDDRVAIAGGKVLYVKGRELLLDRRVLAQGRFAGFDLAPDRAVWAVGRPGGFQRIVLERP